MMKCLCKGSVVYLCMFATDLQFSEVIACECYLSCPTSNLSYIFVFLQYFLLDMLDPFPHTAGVSVH